MRSGLFCHVCTQERVPSLEQYAHGLDRSIRSSPCQLFKHAATLELVPMQDIGKAGVGIHGDAQKLMRDFGLQCEGLVDLSEEANLRLCHPASGRPPEKWSLASELLTPYMLCCCACTCRALTSGSAPV